MTTEAPIAAEPVGSPVERNVRPLRWLCQSCGWAGDDAELLRALGNARWLDYADAAKALWGLCGGRVGVQHGEA